MSTRIIPITVQDEYVIGSGVPVGSAGSGKDISLEITFSESWSEYSKRINWVDSRGGNATLTLLTDNLRKPGETDVYIVPIPFGPKSYQGNMTVTIQGYVLEDDEIEQIQVSTTATFKVLPADWQLDDDESVDPTVAEQLQTAIEAKQDQLTFDDVPTDGSDNPVKSNGIYDELVLKAPIDSPDLTGEPTAPDIEEGSTNNRQIANKNYVDAETARAMAAEATKQDTLTFDNIPTDGSSNPVKSGGVYSAIADEATRAQAAEALLAPLASPELSGTPAAPTAATGTDTTQIATTAFVQQEIEANDDLEIIIAQEASATIWDEITTAHNAGKVVVLETVGTSPNTRKYYRLVTYDFTNNMIYFVYSSRNIVYTYVLKKIGNNYSWTLYTDSLAKLASPSLTGTPTAPTPTSDSGDTQIATKKYVDDSVSPMLPKAGGTMTGAIAMGSNKITGLAEPTNDGDAVNKKSLYDSLFAILPVDKVTGAVASFPDGADDIPVKGLAVTLSPIQSLNGYDNPWPAGGGKNKFDSDVLLTATGWTKTGDTYSGNSSNLNAKFKISEGGFSGLVFKP